MAKRKRLTPAKLDAGIPAVLETKSAFARPATSPSLRPPIADVAHDAATSAALSEVAQTLTDARAEGRLIQPLPLHAIDADYLVRDRMAVDADDMATLMESLRVRGQQTAIEVTALDNGRFGLISGWRRLTALRQMQSENPGLDTILAIIRQPQDAAAAYLAMVEENEIRVGLSYYERARIVARAVDRGVYNRDRVALAALFHAASRPKRSKIGAFIRIVRTLDDHLRFPTALTERTGLALAQALEEDAIYAERVIAALTPQAKSADAEVAAIQRALRPDVPPGPAAEPADKPVVYDLPNGLRVTADAKGRLIVEGDRLQETRLRQRLIDLLGQQ